MYGIIYKTTYLPTGEWYVGKHKCDSEEFDGYLGSGKIITEMRKTKSSSLFKRTTLAIAENKEDLTNLEIFYIEALNCLKDPHCWNISIGGEDIPEFTSEELIKRFDRYWNGESGKEHREKAANQTKAYWESEEGKARKATGNIFEKVADFRKSVVCFETGKVFDSVDDAAASINITSCAVGMVCRKERKTAGGLHWYFLDATEEEKKELQEFWNKAHGLSKKIICEETGVVYDSAAEAGNKTKICTANILAVCSGRRKIAGGFHWRYAEDGGDQ